MICTILISVLSITVVILGFTTFNLLKKNEKAEDMILGYSDYLDKLSRIIEFSDEKIKKLDQRQMFSSDDEIGFFFKQVKAIQGILNEFKVKNY
mgnify:CR=1 FL=1